MKKAILATKIGMTQIFKEDGTLIPVTVLEAQPNVVTQVKTAENDGYEAVQVATVDAVDRVKTVDKNGKVEVAHRHGVNRAEKGHFEKPAFPARSMSRSSDLKMPRITSSAMKSRLTSSLKATESM